MIQLPAKFSRSWFAWSLVLPLTTLFVTLGIMSIPPNTRGIDIAAGRDLFRAHCGSCHFARVGFPAHHGPNLHDIGRSGATRKPNQSAPEYILESILEPSAFIAPSGRPGMPPNVGAELDPEEVRNIIGFLASCGAFPDYDELVALDIPDRRSHENETTLIRLTDMQLAEHVLREKGSCLKCHTLYSVPESCIFAPALFAAGLNDAKTIEDSMTQPDKEIMAKYKAVTILLTDGQLVSGMLVSRNDEQLVVCMADDENQLSLREIRLENIEESEDGGPEIRESTKSLMPSNLTETLTRQEIEAAINLIRQLN